MDSRKNTRFIISLFLLCACLTSFKKFHWPQTPSCPESIKVDSNQEPQFETPVSQLATEGQFHSPKFKYWCDELHESFKMHRKLWEYCYVMEVLDHFQMLQPGRIALGFGVGKEPIPALLAKFGISVLASDQDFRAAQEQGWASSDQYTQEQTALNSRGICDPKQFEKLAHLTTIDMNHIPASEEGKFDIVWSCCSLEHLGSIEAGLEFIKNSVKCLKPGGIAVHTTEFNLSSNQHTLFHGGTVLFRQQDIVRVTCELANMGYHVIELNFNPGSGVLDRYVDVPPYSSDQHVKLQIENFYCTSIGIIVCKPR